MEEEWTEADSDAARREGWDLWEVFPGLEIQRIDDADELSDETVTVPQLDSDYEAFSIVFHGAKAGSALHLRALRLTSERTRRWIEEEFGPLPSGAAP